MIEDPYDYTVHVPFTEEVVCLHRISSVADIAAMRCRLGLADPNIYATKCPDKWNRSADDVQGI
jgi:hypothetical protein